ncbi:MAG: hypothetical protein ACTSW1_00700 [Candidatus Hodarchaeales archaeon]
MKKILSLLIIILLLVSSISSARRIKHISREYVERHQKMSFWNKIKFWFSRRFLTMVGGYLCSTFPDEQGECKKYSCCEHCPSTTKGGCAVDIWDVNRNFVRKELLDPGDPFWIETAYLERYWDLYYCNKKGCTCTDFVGGPPDTCGDGPCDSDEYLRSRICTPRNCDDEQVCIYSDECVAPPSCPSGTMGECSSSRSGDWSCKNNHQIYCEEYVGGIYCWTDYGDCTRYGSNYVCENGECVSGCEEKWLDEYRCSGDWVQRRKQYPDCMTQWLNYENCNDDDGYYGSWFCKSDDVYRKYRDYYCSDGSCHYSETDKKIEDCPYGCENGECKSKPGEVKGILELIFEGVINMFAFK